MNKQIKKNRPALRFPEFEGEWEVREIEKSIDLLTGYPFKGEDISEENGGIPLLRGINITEGTVRHNSEIDRFYHGETKGLEKYFLNLGDLVLGMDGSKVGKNSAIINNKDAGSLLIQRVARIRAKKNSCLAFIYHHINSIRFHRYVAKVNTSSGIPHISAKQIKDFKIGFPPSLPEQKKIAQFLTAIDTRLQQLAQKVALLEDYKKGVLQQLFSRRIRFRDEEGKEFPEWEERRFGEVFERVTRKNKENNQNVLTISAQQGLVNQEDYFNKSVAAKDVTGYYLLHRDEFAYNKSYSKGYPLGAIKRLTKYEKGVVSTLYICFRIKPGNSQGYFEQYFESGSMNREIHKIAQEGARNHGLLNVSVVEFFRDIHLLRPSLPEQQKIADFLGAIDRKIELARQQLEQAQDYKKGLLQQMFV